MRSILIAHLVNVLLNILSNDVMKLAVDKMLDFVEDYVTDTTNKVDDALVLPLCRRIRETFDVPDND
jgi:hypothetical protein